MWTAENMEDPGKLRLTHAGLPCPVWLVWIQTNHQSQRPVAGGDHSRVRHHGHELDHVDLIYL